MATIIDFETGVAHEPPCEEVPGSNPFPWVRAIRNADGTCFIRVTTAHDHFIDVEISSWTALDLMETLAGYLRSMK